MHGTVKSRLIGCGILLLLTPLMLLSTPGVSSKQIRLADGLINNVINSIVQDQDGFVWIGTSTGLQRFDGTTFKLYSSGGERAALPSKYVKKLYVDDAGNLWVGSNQHISRYHRESDSFTHYAILPDDNTHGSVSALQMDAQNRLWVGVSGHGVLIFDPVEESFAELDNLYPAITRWDTLQFEEPDARGIAHKWVTFIPDHWGDVVEYKFVRHTQEESALFEGSVNAASSFGNRFLELNAPEIKLAPVKFNEVDHFKPEDWPITKRPDQLDAIRVRFSLDMSSMLPKEASGVIRIHGNTEPLRWIYQPGNPQTIARYGDSMLVGTKAGGFHLIDLNNGKVDQYWQQRGDELVLPSNYVFAVAPSADGTFWLASLNGLIHFSLETGVLQRLFQESSSTNILDVTTDASGAVWYSTTDGWVCRLEPGTQTLNYRKRLSTQACTDLMIDGSGLVWVGTAGSGLFQLDPAGSRFPLYDHRSAIESPSAATAIHAIAEDQHGRIWLGGRLQGMIILDRIENTWQHIQMPATWTWDDMDFTVRSITPIKADQMLVATRFGIITYDLAGNTTASQKYDPYLPGSMSSSSMQDILETQDGRIWMVDDWLNEYLPEESRFAIYVEDADSSGGSIEAISGNFLMESNDGSIWIGSSGRGLIRFNPETRVYETFSTFKNRPMNASFPQEDTLGQIWFVSNSRNIYSFDPVRDELQHHFAVQEIAENTRVQGFVLDNNGEVWISTTQGICHYEPYNGSLMRFYEEDGLQGIEFGYRAAYKDSAGDLYFGGDGGLNIFNPADIEVSHFEPQIFPTRLIYQTGANIQDVIDLTPGKSITLAYNESDFSIEFAALDFRRPDRNMYSYQLEGYAESWSSPASSNVASYTNLSPGKYTFKVRGTNRDGIWSPNEAALKIKITPPWWRTFWAYGLYILIGMLLLWQIRRVELRRIALENKILLEETRRREMQEVDRVKTNFFTNISHEFRTPLTLILGPLRELMAESSSERDQRRLSIMERSSQRLLKLINQLLELSRLDAHESKLDPHSGDLVAFLKGIMGAFQSHAEAADIDIQFTSDVDELIMGFDHERCEQIFANILGNAFKFTPSGGSVSLVITKSDPMVQVAIEDTGPGIPPEKQEQIFDRFRQVDDSLHRGQEGTGIGLSLAKQLVELHQGTISVASDGSRGATFIVSLPTDLPAASEPEERTETREADIEIQAVPPVEEDESSRDRPTLLLIEDNADMRNYIHDIMQPDYQVIEAEDGVIGIEMATELSPDLIISDLMMPRKDGFEVSETLKNSPQTSHIPIILLTARAEHDSKLTGLETGADDYLVKPFDSRELKTRIANLIHQRESLRTQYRNSIHLEPSEITVTSADAKFLQQVKELIEEDFQNEALNVEWLSQQLSLSRRQFYHKIKTLTGDTPVEFILNLRLKRAAQLLEGKAGTVSEIAYQVGFNNLSYFARAFKKTFGVPPSGYPKS